MKKWTMFPPLCVLFALTIALLLFVLPPVEPAGQAEAAQGPMQQSGTVCTLSGGAPARTKGTLSYINAGGKARADWETEYNNLKKSDHFIINAGVIYWWHDASNQGIKFHIQQSDPKDFFKRETKFECRNSILNGQLFSLPSTIAFKDVSKEEAGAYLVSRNSFSKSEIAQATPNPPMPTPVPTPTPPPSLSKAQAPIIEKASLRREYTKPDFSDWDRYVYSFRFDFVNAMAQPIEIMSVNVLDMNGQKVEQDWGMSADQRLLTHALSGNHPLVKILSKPGRPTHLEQATISPPGGRTCHSWEGCPIEIEVTNRIMSAGQAIRPSGYLLGSKNNYDSLILRVAYRVNGNLKEVSRTFTVGMREEEKPPSTPVVGKAGDILRTPVQCSGAPFIFPIPAVDKSGKNSYIGWLYKEPTFGWPNTTPDKSYYHSGLDFWASPNTPVMGQATGTVHQIENGNSGTFKPTIKYPNITYLDNNGNKKTGDVYVYIDNLVAGKIGDEAVKVPQKDDPVRAGKIIGLIGNAYDFIIDGQQHIHWSISPEPGKDQNLIQTPQSKAIQLDPTSFLIPNGKSLNARGERVWNTDTLSGWCTGGQGK